MELLLVFLVMLYVGWQHVIFSSAFERQSQMLYPDKTVPTATDGNRVLFETDCYTWLSLSRQMIMTGEWRINHTTFDNPPHGREVHWNSLLCWLLVVLAWISHLLSGDTIYAALENAAFQINLILLVVLGGLWYGIARARLGRWPTLVSLALLMTLPQIEWAFLPGNADHQTLHLIALLGCLGFLLRGGLGWMPSANSNAESAPRDSKNGESSRDFIISGAFGALGLWIGATVQLNTLLFTGVAVALLALLFIRKTASMRDHEFDPALWRRWGYSGAAFTLLFFLIQYFPNDMRMRLEAIHPLHAVSWAGAGWLLAWLCETRQRAAWPRIADPKLWLAVCALFSFPIAVAFGPKEWHIFHDPVVVRFQTTTPEVLPLNALGANLTGQIFAQLAILPAFFLTLPLLFRKDLPLMLRSSHLLSAVFALGFFFLAIFQRRWMAYACLTIAIFVATSLALFLCMKSPRLGRFLRLSGFVAALGPIAYFAFSSARDRLDEAALRSPISGVVTLTWQKRLARILHNAKPEGSPIVLCDPDFAPSLFYFGGSRSIASLFWQNAEGLRFYADFFSATDDNLALTMARAREVDFVVVPTVKEWAAYQ